MKRRARVAAVVSAVLLLLVAAAVAAISWQSADKLVHPARSLPDDTPASRGLAYESVSFPAIDDTPLAGWWIPAAESPARGVVMFLHGYGDSKAQSLPLAPFLHEAGYHVLAFDFRAHGESGGSFTTVGLAEISDVRGAIQYAQQRDAAAAERFGVLGYSMGAAAALNTAALEPSIDAIVADSAFATLENIASNSITHFTDLPKYPFGPLAVVFAGWIVGLDVADNAPVRAIGASGAPLLVIQGTQDTIALPDEDGAAIAAAAASSELWLVPEAAHVQSHALAPTEYEARVLAFFEMHLSDA